jgi:hypothetical protein
MQANQRSTFGARTGLVFVARLVEDDPSGQDPRAFEDARRMRY